MITRKKPSPVWISVPERRIGDGRS
jgi:hypothetical protein